MDARTLMMADARWRDWLEHPCTAALIEHLTQRRQAFRDEIADSVDIRDIAAMAAARAEQQTLGWVIEHIADMARVAPKEQ